MTSLRNDTDELFEDGIANAGAIFKRGDEVIRPLQAHSRSVHLLLKHLENVGFSASPRPIAIDETTERISFMPGSVPVPPYPNWALQDQMIFDIAQLQRQYHEAAKSFKPAPDCIWDTALADPTGIGIVCHNDLGPGNVVFTNEKPTGFIDWDFAAPGNPIWDATRCARAWIPLDEPVNAAAYGFAGLNPIKRLQVFCEGYGMDKKQRAQMLDYMNLVNRISVDYVAEQAKQGKPAFVKIWKDYKLDELYRVRTEWIEGNHENFVKALL